MFIIKFNNMVRNKWVWACFALIVAVAFGASDILSSSRRADTDGNTRYGKLDGNPINEGRYQLLERRARLPWAASRSSREQIWQDYAALVRADELGLSASNEEVADAVRAVVKMYTGSDWNAQAYDLFLDHVGLNRDGFENILRVDIVLGKLSQIVTSTAFAPLSVAEDRAHGEVDRFTISVAELKNTATPDSVELSENAARKYYDANKSEFTDPEHRKVSYVVFSSKDEDCIKEVSLASNDEDLEQLVLDYFNNNLDEFLSDDSDKIAEGPTDEQRALIISRLTEIRAASIAYDKAATFAEKFTDPLPGETTTFEAEAEKSGRQILTTELVAISEASFAEPSSAQFWNFVFNTLDLDDSSAVSEFADEDRSYVVRLLEVVPQHVLDFEEVAAKAELAARQETVATLFRQRQDEVYKVFDSLPEGASFAEAATQNGLSVWTNMTFTVSEAARSDLPSARNVAILMSQLDKGAFSGWIPSADGVLCFQVLDREPGSSVAVLSAREYIASMLEQSIVPALWTDWLAANLASLKPEPRVPFEDDKSEDYDF